MISKVLLSTFQSYTDFKPQFRQRIEFHCIKKEKTKNPLGFQGFLAIRQIFTKLLGCTLQVDIHQIQPANPKSADPGFLSDINGTRWNHGTFNSGKNGDPKKPCWDQSQTLL